LPDSLRAPARDAVGPSWPALVALATTVPPVSALPAAIATARQAVDELRERLATTATAAAEESSWSERLLTALTAAAPVADYLVARLREGIERAEAMIQAMDFGLLYDRERRLFYIGYNVTAGRMDPHHYDLLASEARLASFLSIALADVPE